MSNRYGENLAESVVEAQDTNALNEKTTIDPADYFQGMDSEDSNTQKKFAASLLAGIEEKQVSGNITAIRYTDGTMIAYGHIDISFSGTVSASASIGTIPLAFANTSYKVIAMFSDDGGGAYAAYLNATESGARNTTSFSITGVDVSGTSKTGTYRAEWFAIGTWS